MSVRSNAIKSVARSVAGLRPAPPCALEFEAAQEREAARFREQADAAEKLLAERRKFVAFGDPEWKRPLNKSFALHLGAEVRFPVVSEPPAPERVTTRAEAAAAASDPFEGLPLAALAERIGGRIAPVYAEFKKLEDEAARESKRTARSSEAWEPSIPHFLPCTRLAVSNPQFKKTFLFDEKDRKTARLSWYHPDDTMVPRDWFKGGLLADIKYYFGRS